MSKNPIIPVVFRVWKGTKDVIALFPTLPADYTGLNCLSYERLGGHGGADYERVMDETRAATTEEYAATKHELETTYTYRLQVRQRCTPEMRDERRAAAQRARGR